MSNPDSQGSRTFRPKARIRKLMQDTGQLHRLAPIDRYGLSAVVIVDLAAGLYLQATLALHGLGQIGTFARPWVAIALWVIGAFVLYHVVFGHRHPWSDELLLVNIAVEIMSIIEIGFTDGRTTEVRTALALIILAATMLTASLWLRIFVLHASSLIPSSKKQE